MEAVFLSGLVFALFHLNPVSFLALLELGIFFGLRPPANSRRVKSSAWLAWASSSCWPCSSWWRGDFHPSGGGLQRGAPSGRGCPWAERWRPGLSQRRFGSSAGTPSTGAASSWGWQTGKWKFPRPVRTSQPAPARLAPNWRRCARMSTPDRRPFISTSRVADCWLSRLTRNTPPSRPRSRVSRRRVCPGRSLAHGEGGRDCNRLRLSVDASA
jgi:hypothetical protein